MTVRAQEFGEAKANINNLMQSMANHIKKTEEAIERIDQRINDHMDKEEMERKAMEKMIRDNEDASQLRHAARAKATDERFAKIELFMSKMQWGLGLLGFVVTIVAPIVWKLFGMFLDRYFTYTPENATIAMIVDILHGPFTT